MIEEKVLIELIKKLKKNGYKVKRDGSATEEGFATGMIEISYHDKSKKYNIIHEIDLVKVEDAETLLIERFNL